MSLALTVIAMDVSADTFSAATDVWLREAGPDITFENDLISVWSASGNDGARRYGVIDFDISSLAGQPLASATLRLWAGENGFSDDLKQIKQSAVSIDTSGGTATSSMTWNTYQSEYSAGAKALETLGTIDFAPTGAGDLNAFVSSDASAADLVVLESAASSANGLVSLVLIADEDGNDYAKSWGDGPGGFGGMAAELEITVAPEPTSMLLGVIGLGLLMIGRKRLATSKVKP